MMRKSDIVLPSGTLALPAFFADATRGFVRSADAQDVAGVGTNGLQMSAWHLFAKPGLGTIAALGGLHRFTGWEGPILTDSGGFQVYSILRGNPALGSVRRDEIRYRTDKGGEQETLSPEKCVRGQMALGADIVMCLDWCTHPDDDACTQEKSVETTVRWAKKCRETYLGIWKGGGEPGDGRTGTGRPLLFGIIQGGRDENLRRQCASSLLELGFDGYGFGGWPLDGEGKLMAESLALVARLVPEPFVRYAMGVGYPEEIVQCVQMGYALFDCVIPTREARHHRLLMWNEAPETSALEGAFYSKYYVLDEKHYRDSAPVSRYCDCPLCARYSRAFLQHLFKSGDMLAGRLATLHNLRFYAQLMSRAGVLYGARG